MWIFLAFLAEIYKLSLGEYTTTPILFSRSSSTSEQSITNNRMVYRNTTTLLQWSTTMGSTQKTFYQNEEENLLDFVDSKGLCGTNFSTPKRILTSCKDRCGEVGEFDTHTHNCSCHLGCYLSESCCSDIPFYCSEVLTRALSQFKELILHNICELQGFISVRGCYGFDSFSSDIQLYGAYESYSNTTSMPLQSKNLKDFLGNSVEKIEDKQNGLVFRGRMAYSKCKLTDSVPMSIPREILLHCSPSDIPNADIQLNTSPKDPGLLEVLSEESRTATVVSLSTYLYGCNVSRVVDVQTSSMQRCHVPYAIHCYDPRRGKEFSAFIRELCLKIENIKSPDDNILWSLPYLLFSDQTVHAKLRSGVSCFYFHDDGALNEVTEYSDLLRGKKALMTITESDSGISLQRMVEETNGSKTEVAKHPVLSSASKYTVNISALGFETFLECPSLNVHLHQCQFLNRTFLPKEEDESARELVSVKEAVSLRASLQRVGRQQRGVPVCICMMLQAALVNLKAFSVKTVDLRADDCMLQLRPLFEDPLDGPSEEDFGENLQESADYLSQWQMIIGAALEREINATARNNLGWNKTIPNLSHPHKIAERSGNAESNVEDFLEQMANTKFYLEHYMVNAGQVCPYDSIKMTKLCFLLQVVRHLSTNTNHTASERCFLLRLAPGHGSSNEARHSPRRGDCVARIVCHFITILCLVKLVVSCFSLATPKASN